MQQGATTSPCSMKLLLAFLLTASSVLAAPTPQWGPVSSPLVEGAFAKEGLDTDNLGTSFSVGYETTLGNSHALLSIRAATGAPLSTNLAPPPLMGGGQVSCYAGVDAETNGSYCYTVGTHYPTGINGAATSLLVVKWMPSPTWSTPAIAWWSTFATVPGLLPALHQQISGCRVILPPVILDRNCVARSVIFVAGCSEAANFVLCLDRATGLLVPAWGNLGAQSVTSPACPKHLMPGVFPSQPVFANYRQSFIERLGGSLYLGGTRQIAPGNAASNRFEVTRILESGCFVAGDIVAPFSTQIFPSPNGAMKALSAVGNLIAAVGGNYDVGWRPTGVSVFSGLGAALLQPATTMNDVESATGVNGGGISGVFVHIGGKAAANGVVFRSHISNFGVITPQFVQPYGAPANPANEVYDLTVGTVAPWKDWTFAIGGVVALAGFDAPLLEVNPTGGLPSLAAFTNNPNPTWPDRGNAALFLPGFPPSVFTHGNQQSTVPVSSYGRNVRWNP